MFAVIQKYYNDGNVTADIIRPCVTKGERKTLKNPFIEENENYDLYIDYFDTREEAEKFKEDALKA